MTLPTPDPTLTDDDAVATTACRQALTSDGADVCVHETNDPYIGDIGEYLTSSWGLNSEHDSMDMEI